MNESTSKSSFMSLGGKSSTATSSSCHKTRTVIVARTIQDEIIRDGAARGEDQATGASDVVNQQHFRDARSGKLSSYAALGGSEDVDRFDKFLAQQRGQPSASELRAAASSPQHLMGSMKRKTMSRIPLDINEGQSNDAAATTEDAATCTLKQHELEGDARKRREEVVAHRKWLNSLPIHERVAQQRQQNVLRKWRQMNRDWETFKVRAARRLGKPPQELVMSRAAAYREQREMYDALQKARPLSDKVGGDIWLVSLRNEGTRFVPVGNIFSGLFCPIRESTKLGPSVRRPLDYLDTQQEASRPLSKLEKRSLSLLARKKLRLRKQLEVIQPHEVDRSASSHLAVGTIDLFAWASGSLKETTEEDAEEEDETYSANANEDSHRQLRLLTSSDSFKAGTKEELQDHFAGPSLRIAHVPEDDAMSGTTQESVDVLSDSNPETYRPLRLSFYTPVNEQEQRSLLITNDGSTIIHYQWWRAPFEDDNGELTARLRGHRTRKEEQELESCKTISVSRLGGTLLPGETQQFVFTFQSSRAGVFLEKWLLDAEPQPRVCFGYISIDVDTTESSMKLPVEVRLSCVAEDNFAAWRRRRTQLAVVEQSESHFFVANLVDDILDHVKPSEVVVFSELTPNTEVDRFYEQNGSSEFCDAYFSHDIVSACHALYEQAQNILRALSKVLSVAPEVQETEEDGAVNGDNNSTEKTPDLSEQINSTADLSADVEILQEAETPPILLPHLVEEWDWRLETLRNICISADEALKVQIRRLTVELKEEIEEVEDENEEEEDEDAEDDEEDLENEEVDTEKIPRVSPQDVRKIQRIARRKALEDEIGTLTPNLHEAFDTLRFSAYTAPYSTTRLHEHLYERIGSLCSEAPVVCDIAKLMSDNDAVAAQAAKVEGVGKLLMRAIDEAISEDLEHQTLFEQERRRLQGMWLKDKSSYSSIGQLLAKQRAVPAISSSTENADIPTKPGSLDSSGVLLVQLDLDLAPWFSLVKVDNRGATALVDGTHPKVALAWHFSTDLMQHSSFVPAKMTQAAASLTKILDTLSSIKPHVHTVVLVSELSRPPLTKKMYRLLRSVAQAELKANSTLPTPGDGVDQGNESNGEAERTTMKSLLEHLSAQLSFQKIAPIVQRAMQKEIVFCSSLEEVERQIELSRKELLLNSALSLDGTEGEVKDTDGDAAGRELAPKILLLEHLDAAGKDVVNQALRQRELASLKPATPAPSEPQKPVSGTVKKTSVTGSTKRKPSAPAPVPPVENPPSLSLDLTKFDFAGKDARQQGTMALCSQFSRMFSACILDGMPSRMFESVFTFDTFEMKNIDAHSPPPKLAGPTLYEEMDTWSQILQPSLPDSTSRRVVSAVVGGKSLEAKLRLIDSLLEFVHEIYFVGELAMSFYRVLHTKQTGKSSARTNNLKPDEEEAELENDVETGNNEGDELGKEGIPEDDADERSNEIEANDSMNARPKNVWSLLIPAVEKLQQKASRKCVRLLLPVDWIVGEIPLEDQDVSVAAMMDDEDEEEEEEDESDEDEEEEDSGRKSRNRRVSKMKSARQKPLIEPDDADLFDQKHQGVYEGERAHVALNYESSKRRDSGWRLFHEVTSQFLSKAHVIEGKASILTSLTPESEGDDVDDEGDDAMIDNFTPAAFEYEWTFRAMDVGPIAMEALQTRLNSHSGTEVQSQGCTGELTQSKALIVSGLCGAVEFYEFCTATKRLLGIIRDYNQSDVFIAGYSTASWLRQLEIEQLTSTAQEKVGETESSTNANVVVANPVRKVVEDRAMRNAHVLKQILAAKPHIMLASLASTKGSSELSRQTL